VSYDRDAEAAYLMRRLEHAISYLKVEEFAALDIGSGPGDLLRELRKLFSQSSICGVDPSVHNVEEAKTFNDIELVHGFWEGQVSGNYDLVSIFGSLMLHPDLKDSLRMAVEKLSQGGIIIFDYKNPYSAPRQFVRSVMPFIPDSGAKSKLYDQAFHGLPVGFNLPNVEMLLKSLGLTVLEVNGLRGRNIEIGKNIGLPMPFANAVDRLMRGRSWIEVIARRDFSG
jgi:SAM-dependent methyltransferase